MFAILFEVLLIEIQEEIPHVAGWEGGEGLDGRSTREGCDCRFQRTPRMEESHTAKSLAMRKTLITSDVGH